MARYLKAKIEDITVSRARNTANPEVMVAQELETLLTLRWWLLSEKPMGVCFVIVSLNVYLV